MNLRARTYNPRWGAFTSVDPVEGILSRSASRNGYNYVEGNPTNLVDPSGRIWWWLVAAGIGAFLGGFTYGAGSHLGRGGNFGDALGQGVLWGAGSAAVVGALGYLAPQTMSGALLGAAGMLKGAIAPAAGWLAKSPVLKWGMIGAEAEWGRQTLEHLFPYNVGTSQFTNNVTWDALHPAQYDWWKIAKAGVFSGASRAVLGAFGYTGQRLSPFSLTRNSTAAALYGGGLSVLSGVFVKTLGNSSQGLRGIRSLSGISMADIAWLYLGGSLVGGLTSKINLTGFWKPLEDGFEYSTKIGLSVNFGRIAGHLVDRAGKIGWLLGLGTLPVLGQTALGVIEGNISACQAGNGFASSYSNLTSLLHNPWIYGISNFAAGVVAGDFVNDCSRR